MRALAPGYALGPGVQEILPGPRSGITSLAGLAGKTIAVNALNSETTDLLFSTLDAAGITPARVHGVAINGYGVLASWQRKHPRTAAAFRKAVEQGNAIAATDEAALHRALQTSLHLSPQVVAVMAIGTFPVAVDTAQLQRIADPMLRYGQLGRPFNAAALTR